MGQYEEAKKDCEKVILKNCAHTRALSIIIQASSKESLKEVLKTMPKPYRTSYDVAIAISHFELKKGNLAGAEKWLEIAIKKDKENSPELKGYLGRILFEQVAADESIFFTEQIEDKDREKLNKSIELLTEAWEAVQNTDLVGYRLEWIINRSVARGLLGDKHGAIKDIDTAIALDPLDHDSIRNRAILAYEIDDIEKAINLLKGSLILKLSETLI